MNEVKKMRRELRKYKAKLQERLYEILNDLVNKDVQMEGLTLDELTRKVHGKTYSTRKETTLVYRFIIEYRKTIRPDLVCFEKRKYGFPSTREQVEQVIIDKISVISGFNNSLHKFAHAASNRLGYNGGVQKFIQNKMKERMYDEEYQEKADK